MILKSLHKKLRDFEGFRVRFTSLRTGQPVHEDRKRGLGNYNFERKAPDYLTVKKCKNGRLRNFTSLGWRAHVQLASKSEAHGGMSLRSLRHAFQPNLWDRSV